MPNNFLNELNKEQREVATTIEGPLLVLAGAGSGKTRSIIYRTAYMIKVKKIPPWNILIVTFTNKAAKELKYRLKKTFSIPADMMWVGTFHSVCARILRIEAKHTDYDSNFTIYDEKDQTTLLKRITKNIKKENMQFTIPMLKNIISNYKNNLVLPKDFFEFNTENAYTKTIYKIYKKYQDTLKSNNAMDFDDLLLNTDLLLYYNKEIREKYSNKFKYIMIDEYQDTNYAQFKFVNLLAQTHQNLCVVGDDDQAIYGWRGADVRNILKFEKDYKNVKTIKLQKNYRSTKPILDMANSLIRHNKSRHKKILETDKPGGIKPIVMELDSDYKEAEYIAEKIYRMLEEGANPNQIAIFYRTNAQSRIFEKVFINYAIPYRLVGAINFFARKEIKDILAYLKILVNPNDDISFLRIINFPKRGLGTSSVNKLSVLSNRKGKSLLNTLKENLDEFPPTVQKKFEPFLLNYKKWLSIKDDYDIVTLIETIIIDSGMKRLYENSKDIQNVSRWENILELVASAEEFIENFEEDREPELEDFLNHISLQTSADRRNLENQNAVSLMTIHNAKGLEFDCVFVSGVEEGLLPHIKSIEEDNDVEEERRLFYVAITRAKTMLVITYAQYRRFLDSFEPTLPSRFLKEIDQNLYDYSVSKSQTYSYKPVKSESLLITESQKYYRIGQRVHHKQFGNGIIINVDGADENAKLTISFQNGELKKVIGRYVEKLD